MNKVLMAVALLSFVVISGCAISEKTSGVWVEKGRLSIEDPAFAANIVLVRDLRDRTDEGFLRAQVFLQNTNRTDFRCQYCFEWMAENGMIQKHQSAPWRPLVMHGREMTELEAISLLQDTADFRLKIRRQD